MTLAHRIVVIIMIMMIMMGLWMIMLWTNRSKAMMSRKVRVKMVLEFPRLRQTKSRKQTRQWLILEFFIVPDC